MNQTNFLFSNITSKQASFAEIKSTLLPDVLSTEGKTFFTQLAQLASGYREAHVYGSIKSIERSNKMADVDVSSDVFLKNSSLSADGEDIARKGMDNLIPESMDVEDVSNVTQLRSANDAVLLSMKIGQISDINELSMRQVQAKQDGEALLLRLDEANAVLQIDTRNVDISSELTLKLDTNASAKEDKGLPFTPIESGPFIMTPYKNIELTSALEWVFLVPEQAGVINILSFDGPKVEVMSETELALLAQVSNMAIAEYQVREETNASFFLVQTNSENNDKMLVTPIFLIKQIAPNFIKASSKQHALTSSNLSSTTLEALQLYQMLSGAVDAAMNTDAQTETAANSGGQSKIGNEILMLMQNTKQNVINSTVEGNVLPSSNALISNGLMEQSQAYMTQSASVANVAMIPQVQQQPILLTSANAISVVPVGTEADFQLPQSRASVAVLEAAAIQALSKAGKSSLETEPVSFIQQLAFSFGNQRPIIASKLDIVTAQTALQMNQNQIEAANALSERINAMLLKNCKHIDIRLDPPELGSMQIKLSMNRDQTSVQFIVANQQAHDLIEQSMPRLRDMLQQQGLQLTQSSVQQQDAGGGRQTFRGNQTSQGDGQGEPKKELLLYRGDAEQDTELNVIKHNGYVNVSKERVDYYV
ncbi:flagellar hook-length control protein FliK [Candidatus Enterovibrio altilux]|uniref:flagellar hook-length control protein FliK n=1 Tax=Candidatus Enterovibrio altilux TaxID=1927128 RepID=UPI00123833E6|nr:flagellar hook-length control protein FliK [Candidatus Enterovibrio luxaltus]